MEITMQLRCSMNRRFETTLHQSPTDARWMNKNKYHELLISVPSQRRAFFSTQILWETFSFREIAAYLCQLHLPCQRSLKGDQWKFAPTPCVAYQRRKNARSPPRSLVLSARSRRPRVYEVVAENAGRTRCATLSGVYNVSRCEQRGVAIFVRKKST